MNLEYASLAPEQKQFPFGKLRGAGKIPKHNAEAFLVVGRNSSRPISEKALNYSDWVYNDPRFPVWSRDIFLYVRKNCARR
jgi:hypothetical protein